MRRDALERREALIHAATACFAESGYDVPLEDIADRAGVGRGTLYRNFRDRLELLLVIFEREIDAIGAELDPAQPLAVLIAQIVRRARGTRLLFARLTMDMTIDDSNFAALHALHVRMAGILDPFVARARARGEIRDDASTEQVLLGIRMISGLLKSPVIERDFDSLIADGINLLLRGLGTGTMTGAPRSCFAAND
jgi:AcrR family transcriptional regulator